MKRVIILTVYCLIPLTVLRAQLSHMQIMGKPERLTSEIVSVRDVNGRFCAAVKIISDMEGFSYDSYNGVVRVDDQPGKDMVFLSPDERVLEILHTGYAPLKIILSEIGIQLREREVWKIEISGEQKLIKIPIVVQSNPARAEIIIDGQNKGTSEQHRVTAGPHQIQWRKAGYEPVIRTIVADETHTLFKADLKEIREVPIEISTQPEGATVMIDGVKFGTTPLSDFYKTGRYAIRIEKEAYVLYEDYIQIESPFTRASYPLQENFGSLTVKSSPRSGLSVFLNGTDQQVETPHTFQRLLPGDYVIIARSDLYMTETDTIQVQRGGTHEVNLLSEANFAVLDIETLPGAAVYLNGRRITTLRGIRLEPSVVRIRADMPSKGRPVEERLVLKKNEHRTVELIPDIPLGTLQVAVVPFDSKIELTGDAGEQYTADHSFVFQDIPAGSYSVRASKEGYAGSEQQVDLSEGETKKIMLNLGQGESGSGIKKKKKWPYYVAAVAAGVAVYLLLPGKKTDQAGIEVRMPDEY